MICEICEVVKKIGISAFKMYGNDVPLVLYRLDNKILHPLQIDDLPFYFAGTQSCRECNNLIPGCIGLIDGFC